MPTIAETLAQAKVYHRAGQRRDAERLYRQVLQSDPTNIEAHYLLGVTLGQVNEAIKSLTESIRLDPLHAEAYNLLGALLAQQGKLDEAISSFEHASRLRPDSAEISKNLRLALATKENRLGNALAAQPFTTIVPTAYGQMLVNRYDINQANALFKTGYAIDHDEIVMLTKILQLLQTDLTVLDVGASFGTYSIALARVVGPNGKVHAFEPQRLIYNLLVGSVALNSLTNVYCHNIALGNQEDRVEIPQYDYNQAMNFGSIEFSGEQSEELSQARGHDPGKTEYVPLTTIDRFEFPKAHLIKIDAEGMEMQVLQGSIQTIRRCRPVLYVEFYKCDLEALRQMILRLDYVVHQKRINLLCIPTELSSQIQIPPGTQTRPPGEPVA